MRDPVIGARHQVPTPGHGLVATLAYTGGGGVWHEALWVGGGGSEAQEKQFVPKIGLQIQAPLIHFIFFLRKHFVMWVGVWVGGSGGGSPGCHSAPPAPLVTVRCGLTNTPCVCAPLSALWRPWRTPPPPANNQIPRPCANPPPRQTIRYRGLVQTPPPGKQSDTEALCKLPPPANNQIPSPCANPPPPRQTIRYRGLVPTPPPPRQTIRYRGLVPTPPPPRQTIRYRGLVQTAPPPGKQSDTEALCQPPPPRQTIRYRGLVPTPPPPANNQIPRPCANPPPPADNQIPRPCANPPPPPESVRGPTSRRNVAKLPKTKIWGAALIECHAKWNDTCEATTA